MGCSGCVSTFLEGMSSQSLVILYGILLILPLYYSYRAQQNGNDVCGKREGYGVSSLSDFWLPFD